MKNLERIELIDIIGRELQARMTFSEIDAYFKSYKIDVNGFEKGNSKWLYVKDILPNCSEKIILEIASELKITPNSVENDFEVDGFIDASFWKPGYFRLFISHITSFKDKASLLKNELEKYGISAFVAHEDIEPIKQWQDEIEKGLFTMDALCALLVPGFKESNWTDQEIGVAIGRKILIIPIIKGLDPYGFIGKYQGYKTANKKVHQVAESIFDIICKNPKTKNKYLNISIELFLLSNSKEEALNRIKILNRLDSITEEKAAVMYNRVTDNQNLNDKDVIKEFSKLFDKFKLKKITSADFNKSTFAVDDDLPF
jgi:hypothetical protein